MAELDFTPLTCLLPGCNSPLHLEWSLTRPLYAVEAELPKPEDAYTAFWEVRCEEGHIVQVPPGVGCMKCNASDCEHDVDWDDELRTFRRSDHDRLLAMVNPVKQHEREQAVIAAARQWHELLGVFRETHPAVVLNEVDARAAALVAAVNALDAEPT